MAGNNAYLLASALAAAEGTLWAVDNYGQIWRWGGTTWTQQPSVVAADGSTWFLGTAKADPSGNHHVYRFSNGKLLQVANLFVGLTAGEGTIWAVNAQNQAWQWNGATWTSQPTITGPDGAVWFLGTANDDGFGNHVIFHFYNGRLGRMPDNAVGLGVAEGNVWVIRSFGDAMYWPGTAATGWISVTSVAAADGSVWFLGAVNADKKGDHAIYRWNNGKLATMPGQATNLVAVGGDPWTLDASGQVWQWSGTLWGLKGTGMQTLAVGYGSPYAVNAAGQVLRLDGSSWDVVASSAVTAGDGSAWFLDTIDPQWQGNYSVIRMSNGQVSGAGYATGLGVAGGAVWTVNAAGQVSQWTAGAWYQPGSLVAPDGSVWFLTPVKAGVLGDQIIFRFANNQLGQMPGTAAALLGAAENTVWAITGAGKVLRWNGTAWDQQPSVVAADYPGGIQTSTWTLGVTDADGHGDHLVYRVSNNQLSLVTGEAAALAADGGLLWAVNAAANQPMYWGGPAWSNRAGFSAADGSLFFLGASDADGHGNNSIYRWNQGQLTRLPGFAVSLAVLEGTVWAIDTSSQVWLWNGVSLVQQAGTSAPDGSVWVLGTTDADGQGNHAIYRWSNGQPSTVPGYASGLWAATGTIWSINSRNQLSSWIGGAWVPQSTLTPSADGGYNLSNGPTPVQLINLGSNPNLAAIVAQAMPIIQQLQAVSIFGPNSGIGQAIVQEWANKIAAQFQANVQQQINAAFAAHPPVVNGTWGHTDVMDIWDGFNWDGSLHYRQVQANNGWWDHYGAKNPTVKAFNLTFESFNPQTNQWLFHISGKIQMPIWAEGQLWSYGADLVHSTLSGTLTALADIDLTLTPRLTYDVSKQTLSAGLSVDASNPLLAFVLRFSPTAPGDYLANYSLAALFDLLADNQVTELFYEIEFGQSIGLLHNFQVNASYNSSGHVTAKMYHNGSLIQTKNF